MGDDNYSAECERSKVQTTACFGSSDKFCKVQWDCQLSGAEYFQFNSFSWRGLNQSKGFSHICFKCWAYTVTYSIMNKWGISSGIMKINPLEPYLQNKFKDSSENPVQIHPGFHQGYQMEFIQRFLHGFLQVFFPRYNPWVIQGLSWNSIRFLMRFLLFISPRNLSQIPPGIQFRIPHAMPSGSSPGIPFGMYPRFFHEFH